MKKIRKIIVAVVSLAAIAALFGGCTVKETKYVTETTSVATTSPIRQTTTTSSRRPEVLSVADAIASAQDTTPSLYVYTDSEMIQLMNVACDSLDQWGGNYSGFLSNAQQQLAGESTLMLQETSSLVIAAVFSICTEHQVGLLDAMDSMGY